MQKKLKIVLTSLNKSKKSAHCLRCAGHAPVGLSKRGKTQHSMPDAARKNYLDFTPKNSPLPVTLERYGSLIFCLQLISCTLSRLLGAF